MFRSSPLPMALTLTGVLALPACAGEDDPTSDPMTADDDTTGGEQTTSQEEGDGPEGSTGGEGDTTGGEDPTGEDPTGEDPTGEDDTTSGGIDVGALYDCEDENIMIIPMMGPGFDPETGDFVGPLQDSYVAHTTQAVVGPETMDAFMEVNNTVVEQLMQTEGVLGVGFAVEPECGFLRTIGLWQSEQAMYAFVGSGAHAQAMTQATQISLSGKTTHWTIGSEVMPLTWDMAYEQLEQVEPSPVYD